jgi:hypothetical protein
MRTPVALFIFNRPEATAKVFAEVARAKPPRLLVVADGPRADRPGEADRCAAARALVERVDWDCELLTNYSEVNLGCRRRVAGGLDWVFSTIEEAIILEDDCVPHPTFFRYCDELLERYRDDERVMLVSGDNFLPVEREARYSYYFSRYALAWGWATWRRAWRHYDVRLKLWPELRGTSWLFDLHGDETAARYWGQVLDEVHAGRIDTWDYQWSFACWASGGLCVTPSANLVSNVGFGAGATHTLNVTPVAGLPAVAMGFPLRHPPHFVRDAEADRITFRQMCPWAEGAGARTRLRRKLSALTAGLRRALGAKAGVK